MSMTTFFQPRRSKRRLTKFTGPWQFTQRLMTSCFTPSPSSGSRGIQSAGVRIGADRLSARSNKVFFPGAISTAAFALSACPPMPADTPLHVANFHRRAGHGLAVLVANRALEAAHLDRLRNRGALPEEQGERKCDDFEHGFLHENHG